MRLLVVIGDDVHFAAIRAARRLGKEQPFSASVLNAPMEIDVSNWISRVWDNVEGALNRAYRHGMEAARPLIESATTLCSELADSIVEAAELVQTAIAERLQTYLSAAIDGALQRVRSSVRVGGADLSMVSVKIEQKIKLSGSFKGSVTEVCEFVAEGEISLAAEYGTSKSA